MVVMTCVLLGFVACLLKKNFPSFGVSLKETKLASLDYSRMTFVQQLIRDANGWRLV